MDQGNYIGQDCQFDTAKIGCYVMKRQHVINLLTQNTGKARADKIL